MIINNEKNQEHIDHCRFCWMCRQVCTVATVTNDETMTPRSRSFLLSSIIRGTLNYSYEMAGVIYKCCLCGYCSYWCQGKWEPPLYVKAARQDLVDLELVPEKIQKIHDSLIEKGNPYSIDKSAINQELSEIIMKSGGQGSPLLLLGSAVFYKAPEIGLSLLSLFRKIDMPVTVFRDDFIAYDLLSLGYIRQAKESSDKFVENIKSMGCKEIITVSAEDFYFLTNSYDGIPLLGEEVKIVNILEYLIGYLNTGKINFKVKKNLNVTYHDTNYFARYTGTVNEPREILNSIPGIRLKEMLWSKEEAHSLGSGIFDLSYPELSQKMVALRIRDIKEVPASVVLTSSGDDKRSFLEHPDFPKDIQVLDLIELLDSAV